MEALKQEFVFTNVAMSRRANRGGKESDRAAAQV